jgi:hypothetical protein
MNTSDIPPATCTRCHQSTNAKTNWCSNCGKALKSPAPPGLDLLDYIQPVIQPHDWTRRQHTINRSLCYMPALTGTPWLAFYFEYQGRMEYIAAHGLGRLGLSADGLERRVMRNLSRTPASWRPHTLAADAGQEIPVLLCVDEPHSCERILEQPFLAHAQTMYRSRGLAAAIPQQGMLIVTAFGLYEQLIPIARKLYDTAQNPRISPWVFSIQNGVITGRFFEENGQIGLDAVVMPPPEG